MFYSQMKCCGVVFEGWGLVEMLGVVRGIYGVTYIFGGGKGYLWRGVQDQPSLIL